MALTQRPSADRPATKQSHRNIQIFDNTNIEEFFRQPSPDALNVSSEMRVLEIMEDLKKQTSEELENWSQGQETIYKPLRAKEAFRPSSSTQEAFHCGDLVSSLISLTTPLAESNLISVSRPHDRSPDRTNQGTSNTQSPKYTQERKSQCSAETKDTFALPDKPSFQSFLKRVAKPPPPPPSTVRHSAYRHKEVLPELPTTPQAQPGSSTQSEKLNSHPADDYDDDDEICIRIARSETMPPPKFATDRNPYKRKESSGGTLHTPEPEALTKKRRPRSSSSPAIVIKRKPLPKDSPLFAADGPRALKRSPTFDDIVGEEQISTSSTSKGSRHGESDRDRLDQSLPLPPILKSTLSRGKSFGKKLKSQARILQHS